MDKPVYRASGIYECPRHLSAIRLGVEGEPDPTYLLTAAEEGNLHEKVLKQQLRDEGFEVAQEQEEFSIDLNKSITVTGHIDGWVKSAGWEGLLEIKSMSQFEFDRWMREGWDGFSAYASQVTLYWHMTGATRCLYLVKNRSSGYVQRQTMDKPPRDIKDITNHLQHVESHVMMHGMPMEAEYDPKSIECRRCPYAKVLGCVKEIEVKPAEEAELETARQMWLKGKEMGEAGGALQDGAKEVFIGHTLAHGLKGQTWRLKDISILHHHVEGRVSYPKKELLKIFTEQELAPAEKIGEGHDETRVTKAKDND